MKYFFLLLVLSLTGEIFPQTPFIPVDSSNQGDKLVIPDGMKYDVIFREGEVVRNAHGKKAGSKGNHDYSFYIPVNGSSRHGYFYVSHECNDTSSTLGDGGGGTIFEVNKIERAWIDAGIYYGIDFSPVGGTYNNCGGTYTSSGTILSAEEFPPVSNKVLYKNGAGFRDTSDYRGLKRWQNMGWVVEVDPIRKKALHKLYKMGRFSHEAVLVMPDSMTVYLTDDFAPSVFFKFVAKRRNDFTEGQLYAFQQLADDENKGAWISLPMEMDSLLAIRDVALRRGATIFLRLEWMTMVNGKIYITETGSDSYVHNKFSYMGRMAVHLKKYSKKSGAEYEYPHGSVLEFDPVANSIKEFLSGGIGIENKDKVFSNPDAISHFELEDKKYLVIHEDLIGLSHNRVSKEAEKKNKFINEIWWLDLSILSPTVDDLHRFLIAPAGAESTGGVFTPDYKTFFVNIQHPSASNVHPFNRSATIAITGFNERLIRRKVKTK